MQDDHYTLYNMNNDEEQDYSSIMNKESVSGIIRFLLRHGEAKNIELQVVVANHYRRHNIMDALRDAGLIHTDYQISPKKEYHYTQTEKGKQIGKKLEEIEEILNSL